MRRFCFAVLALLVTLPAWTQLRISDPTPTNGITVQDGSIHNVRPGQFVVLYFIVRNTAPNTGSPMSISYTYGFPWAWENDATPATNQNHDGLVTSAWRQRGGIYVNYGNVTTLVPFTVPTDAVPGTFFPFWVIARDAVLTDEITALPVWIHVMGDGAPRAITMPGFDPNAPPPIPTIPDIDPTVLPPATTLVYADVLAAYKAKWLGWTIDPTTGACSFTADGRASGLHQFAVSQSCCWEGSSWYYDPIAHILKARSLGWGTEVAACEGGFDLLWAFENQLIDGDRLGNPTRTQADGSITNLFSYTTWIENSSGGVGGWRIFAEGQGLAYEATAEARFRQNVINFANNGPWALSAGLPTASVSRETAYQLKAYSKAHDLHTAPDGTTAEMRAGRETLWDSKREMRFSVAYIHAQFDHWLTDRLDPTDPITATQMFMIALTIDALAYSWDNLEQQQKDELFPEVVEILDWGWERFAHDTLGYWTMPINTTADPLAGAADLNAIIARSYAWAYQMTGDQRHADRALMLMDGWNQGAWVGNYAIDAVFTHPVTGVTFPTASSGNNGKQWSQGGFGIDAITAIAAAFPPAPVTPSAPTLTGTAVPTRQPEVAPTEIDRDIELEMVLQLTAELGRLDSELTTLRVTPDADTAYIESLEAQRQLVADELAGLQ